MSNTRDSSIVVARRRAVVTVGLVLLFATSAMACIFERSNYQGGGRVDKGATAGTVSATADAETPPPEDANTD